MGLYQQSYMCGFESNRKHIFFYVLLLKIVFFVFLFMFFVYIKVVRYKLFTKTTTLNSNLINMYTKRLYKIIGVMMFYQKNIKRMYLHEKFKLSKNFVINISCIYNTLKSIQIMRNWYIYKLGVCGIKIIGLVGFRFNLWM